MSEAPCCSPSVNLSAVYLKRVTVFLADDDSQPPPGVEVSPPHVYIAVKRLSDDGDDDDAQRDNLLLDCGIAFRFGRECVSCRARVVSCPVLPFRLVSSRLFSSWTPVVTMIAGRPSLRSCWCAD